MEASHWFDGSPVLLFSHQSPRESDKWLPSHHPGTLGGVGEGSYAFPPPCFKHWILPPHTMSCVILFYFFIYLFIINTIRATLLFLVGVKYKSMSNEKRGGEV